MDTLVVTHIYKPFRLFGREHFQVGDLLTMVINHLWHGMILMKWDDPLTCYACLEVKFLMMSWDYDIYDVPSFGHPIGPGEHPSTSILIGHSSSSWTMVAMAQSIWKTSLTVPWVHSGPKKDTSFRPPKINMTLKHPPFEDVFPIETGHFPMSC